MKKIFLLGLALFLMTGCNEVHKEKIDANSNSATEKDGQTGDNSQAESNKEESISLSDASFYGLYQKLADYTYAKSHSAGYKDFTEKDMFNVILDDIKESDLSSLGKHNEYQNKYGLKHELVLKYLKMVFGENVQFDPEKVVNTVYTTGLNPNDEGSGMEIISFDDATGTYSLTFGGIGGPSFPSPNIEERKIVSAVKKGDEIIVTEKAIYVEKDEISPDESKVTIYDSPAKNKVLYEKSFDYTTAESTNISVDDYEDNYQIVHTFKKNADGTYYFAGNVIE